MEVKQPNSEISHQFPVRRPLASPLEVARLLTAYAPRVLCRIIVEYAYLDDDSCIFGELIARDSEKTAAELDSLGLLRPVREFCDTSPKISAWSNHAAHLVVAGRAKTLRGLRAALGDKASKLFGTQNGIQLTVNACLSGQPDVLKELHAGFGIVKPQFSVCACFDAAVHSRRTSTFFRILGEINSIKQFQPWMHISVITACEVGNARALRAFRVIFGATAADVGEEVVVTAARYGRAGVLRELCAGYKLALASKELRRAAINRTVENNHHEALRVLRTEFKLDAHDARESRALGIATRCGLRECVAELLAFGLTDSDLKECDEFAYLVAKTSAE